MAGAWHRSAPDLPGWGPRARTRSPRADARACRHRATRREGSPAGPLQAGPRLLASHPLYYSPMDPLDAFRTLEIRVGRIVKAEIHAAARKPAYMLSIDFGPPGLKTSSAQLTDL